MKKLENKTVLITGGLSGIGKACAFAAANEGANIAIVDVASSNQETVMQELKEINSTAQFFECDVSNFDKVKTTIDQVVKNFGKLDVACNNAGIGGQPSLVGDMTAEAWNAVISVNLSGVFNCMRHQLNFMAIQKSGVIVNMSSILGRVGFANSAHYVAAKHGVIGLTQTAAIEYATHGIRVNAICPGFISTPLLAKAGINTNPDIKQSIEDLHPMKRFGHSIEVANGFIFLASGDSSFITGTALEIDGGFLAQ